MHLNDLRVLEDIASFGGGTGAYGSLGSAVVPGYRSFASAQRADGTSMATGDTFLLLVECIDASGNSAADGGGNRYEAGIGTYTASNQVTMTTTLRSSNSNAKVNWSAGARLRLGITFFEMGTLTPTALSANQNDYNPTGLSLCKVLRLSSDQPRRLTGLAGGYDGRQIEIQNVSTINSDGEVILNYEDTASTAANRFSLDNDIVLEPGCGALLTYDGTAARWRCSAIRRRYTGSTFRRTPYFPTDFLGAAGADTGEAAYAPWDLAVIASGTQAKVAAEPNHPGILRITSSTTTNSGAYIRTAADAVRFGGGEVSEHVFRLIDLTTLTVRLGYIDTATSADCVDGAYIEIASTGIATGKTSNNSTRTTSATIATLSINTWYVARITVDRTAANVTFQIFDDNGNQLGSQTNSANIPTGAGRETGHGIIGTKSGTTAQAIFDIDFMSMEWTKALV